MTFYFKITDIQIEQGLLRSQQKAFLQIKIQNKLIFDIKISLQPPYMPKTQFIWLLQQQNKIQILLMGINSLGISKQFAYININKNYMVKDHLLRESINLQIKQDKKGFQDNQGHLTFFFKYDKYKKLIYRMAHFNGFNQINTMENQVNRINKDPSLIDHQAAKVPIFITKQNQPKQINKIQQVVKKQQTKQRIKNFYIGPCQTRNIFSCMDPKSAQQQFIIYEHQYQI